MSLWRHNSPNFTESYIFWKFVYLTIQLVIFFILCRALFFNIMWGQCCTLTLLHLWCGLISVYFICSSSVYTAHDHDLFRTLSEWISVDIKIIGQVCLRGSELKKIIYLGFVPSGGHWAKSFFFSLNTNFVNSVATRSPNL